MLLRHYKSNTQSIIVINIMVIKIRSLPKCLRSFKVYFVVYFKFCSVIFINRIRICKQHWNSGRLCETEGQNSKFWVDQPAKWGQTYNHNWNTNSPTEFLLQNWSTSSLVNIFIRLWNDEEESQVSQLASLDSQFPKQS